MGILKIRHTATSLKQELFQSNDLFENIRFIYSSAYQIELMSVLFVYEYGFFFTSVPFENPMALMLFIEWKQNKIYIFHIMLNSH